MFILACTKSDPPMELLSATLETFTLAAQMVSVEHDDDDDAGRSQRNRTTGEEAEAAPANIDEDATATSIKAPDALSNMQLCSVTCI